MPTKRKTLLERAKAKELRQAKRIERSYTRERKIEVLMYLLNHRVPDVRARRFPRRRIGQPHEGESSQQLIVQEDHGDHIWYRAPTYSEASEFWNIPTPTIQGWWDARKKLLEGTGVELPELATTGASPVLNDGTTQPTSGATDRAQGTVPGENVGGQSGRAPAENGAAPTMSGPVPPPNPRQNGAPSANGTSLPDGDGILAPNTSEARTSAAQPAPTGSEQHPAAPAAQRPSANVARPAPRSAALGSAPEKTIPRKRKKQTAPTPPPPPLVLPAAFNPANYIVVYVGPPPGPMPGQHCLHPGAILPVVYSGQTLDVPPMSFVSVFPSHPPGPGSQPPPPPPNATYVGGNVYLDPPPPVPPPGQHIPHGPPGPHPPPYQGQPVMPHGPHPPPNPGQPPGSRGAHPPHEQSGHPPPPPPPSQQQQQKQQQSALSRPQGARPSDSRTERPQPPAGHPGPPTKHIPPLQGPYMGPTGYLTPYARPNLVPSPPVPTNPPPNVMIETGRPQAPAVQTSPAPAVRGPQPTPTANAAPSQTTTAPGPPPPAAHRQPPPAPHGSQAVQIEPSASATPNQPPGVARAENHVLNTAPESAPAAPGASATSPAQAQQQQQQQQQQQHQHQQHQEPEGGRTDASAPEDQGLAPSSPNMDIDTDDVPSGEEAADGAGGSSGTDDGERDSLFESATSTPAL